MLIIEVHIPYHHYVHILKNVCEYKWICMYMHTYVNMYEWSYACIKKHVYIYNIYIYYYIYIYLYEIKRAYPYQESKCMYFTDVRNVNMPF